MARPQCPRCGKPLRIANRVDPATKLSGWYALCPKCLFSMKESYPSKALAQKAAASLCGDTDKKEQRA